MAQDKFAEFKEILSNKDSGYWPQSKAIGRAVRYDRYSLQKWIKESANEASLDFSHITPEEQDEVVIAITAALSLADGAPIITVVGEHIAIEDLLKDAQQEYAREHPNTSFDQVIRVRHNPLKAIAVIVAAAAIGWVASRLRRK
jgi:hypothetical protein